MSGDRRGHDSAGRRDVTAQPRSAAVLFRSSFDPVAGAGDLARIDPVDASMDFVDPVTGEVIFEVTTDIAAASAASRLNGAPTYVSNPTYTWFSSDGRS